MCGIRSISYGLAAGLLWAATACTDVAANNNKKPKEKRQQLINYIITHYPDQLTYPQKKIRKTFSQFGYGLSEFTIPTLPITKFITPNNYGYQSYGRPNRRLEKNGALYTCRGGFIDFSHLRAAIDWTVYLTFRILVEHKDFDLPAEAGTLQLRFRNINKLTVDDIAGMAQKIAYERLTWHEVASWHYHKPYHFIREQQSAFTPEDTYSNFLGTVIGKNVALRILRDTKYMPYSRLAAEEIDRFIAILDPVATKKQSKLAYDIIDLGKQAQLDPEIRNYDVWYDSRIVFTDQRYVFKRYMNIGPELAPWLVPGAERLGCAADAVPEILKVPERTSAGVSLYNHYEFIITPDSNLFYDYKRNVQLHPPIHTFRTSELKAVIRHISKQMEEVLLPGFDRRDHSDPTIYFTDVKRTLLK